MSEPEKVGPGNPPKEHQFKPGESGNPAGKPKGARSLSTILRDFLERELETVDPFEKKQVKMKVSEIAMLKLIKKAINDEDMTALKEILDRMEGKAAQRIDFGGGSEEGGKTGIKLEIIHTNDKPQGDDSPAQESAGEHSGDSK